jgi:small subunit ribosomal protein S4
MERQFKKTFNRAEKRPGITGENLLQGMELRMDNVVFRLGFAGSRNQARQLVRHGHFSLNGRMTNVPSCTLKPDDVIAWMPKSQNMGPYKQAAENASAQYVPAWLALDEKTLEGRVVAAPGRGEIDIRINEQSIVEYYSR